MSSAPAGVDELARGAVEFHDAAVAPQPIVLIPGIRTEAFDGDDAGADGLPFDVMRGEETLVCGLIAGGHLDAGAALLNASSHWKLIRVDARAPRRRQPDVARRGSGARRAERHDPVGIAAGGTARSRQSEPRVAGERRASRAA